MKKMKAAHAVDSITKFVFDTGSTSNVSVSLEGETWKSLCGYIFMCNLSTKLECYQYRVFGLPSGKKEVVEQIKPGAKLFLYDFELKLVYGVYEATSVGKMNLEPTAFKGKFPAQVKFKIYQECLPMPETTLRCVIGENYIGSKFKQELSWKQVKKLISSFRPLYAPPSQPALQAPPNSSLPCTMSPLAMENRFWHTGPAPEVPYLPRPTMLHSLTTDALHHHYHRSPASNYAAHGSHTLYSRYTSSIMQPQTQPYVPLPYHQQVLQIERESQDNATGHGYH